MDQMTATYTEDQLTPFSFDVAAEAMRAALMDALKGQHPTDDTMSLALAKTALETGRWQYIHCYNWGNIKAGQSYVGQYTAFACNEVLGGKVVWFAPGGRLAQKGGPVVAEASPLPPGHYQTRFRAYANQYDGAYEYVDFVASGRYVDAWKELLVGDADGYVNALHAKGYFTADPAVYGRGVKSLQAEFRAKLQGKDWPAAQTEDFDWDLIRATIIGNSLNHDYDWGDERGQVYSSPAA